MNCDYDDWLDEEATCSNGLWHRLRSLCSRGWNAAWSVELSPWTQTLIMLASAVLLVAFGFGCSRTVLVRESDPVRTGPSFKGRIYSMVENEWRLSQTEIEIPEGWYLVPPSYVEGPHE